MASNCVVADAVPIEPVSSLHLGQMQGEFRKMQGDARRNLAKSHQISIVWMASPYSKRAGKEQGDHLCLARTRSAAAGLAHRLPEILRARIAFWRSACGYEGLPTISLSCSSVRTRERNDRAGKLAFWLTATRCIGPNRSVLLARPVERWVEGRPTSDSLSLTTQALFRQIQAPGSGSISTSQGGFRNQIIVIPSFFS